MEFKLTPVERMQLSMLAAQHKMLGIEDGIDPGFLDVVIGSSNEWALVWEYPGYFTDADFEIPERVKFVSDILDAYAFLQSGYEKLNPEQRQELAGRLPEHTSLPPVFPGFDGNNESEYLGVARLFINHMNRFTFVDVRDDLNSHHPTLDRYREVIRKFEEIRPNLDGPRTLMLDEMVRILER